MCFKAAQARALNVPSPHMSVAALRSALKCTRAQLIHLVCHGVQ
jgi:hypothetical protein